MARTRVAVVGIEHYHVTGWVDTLAQFGDRVEIVALYDADPALGERLAPAYHDPVLSPALPAAFRTLPFTTDLEALIREHRPELALVTLPNAAAPAAIATLARAGVHLLVDKPAAKTADEAAAAFAAARAAGVKVAVGLTKRYGRPWRDARELVAAGRLGRLLTAEAIMVTSSVAVRGPDNPLFDRMLSGGGILRWLGVHDVDLLMWLSGEPIVEVQAMAGAVGLGGLAVEDVISVAVRFAGGAIGTIHNAYALPRTGYDGYVALRGSAGALKVTPDKLSWIGPGDRADPIASWETRYTTAEAPGYGTGGLAAVEDLLGAIRDRRDPFVTGEDLVRALRVIDAAYRSAETGERVSVVLR